MDAVYGDDTFVAVKGNAVDRSGIWKVVNSAIFMGSLYFHNNRISLVLGV